MQSELHEAEAKATTLDLAGVVLSILCAAHCVLAPIILTAAPFASPSFLRHHGTESAMIAIIIAVAAVAYWRGYRRHGRAIIFAFLAFGAVVFLILRPVFEGPPEHGLTIIGGLSYVLGHALNGKWSGPHRH